MRSQDALGEHKGMMGGSSKEGRTMVRCRGTEVGMGHGVGSSDKCDMLTNFSIYVNKTEADRRAPKI